MTIIFLQDIISFHWMLCMCVGGWLLAAPPKVALSSALAHSPPLSCACADI